MIVFPTKKQIRVYRGCVIMINKRFYEQNTQGRETIFDDKPYKRGAAVR